MFNINKKSNALVEKLFFSLLNFYNNLNFNFYKIVNLQFFEI